MSNFTENIRRYPFVRLLLPLLAGIVWQIFVPFGCNLVYAILFFFILLVSLNFTGIVSNYRYRWLWGVVLFALIFFTGSRLVQMQKKQSDLPVQTEVMLKGVICENPQLREKSTKIDLQVQQYCDTSRQWQHVDEHVILYVKNDSSSNPLLSGDVLLCKTKLNTIATPQNPAEFDYQKYMAQRGYFVTAYVIPNQFNIIKREQLPFYKNLPLALQNFIYVSLLKAGLTDNELAVATALTIGDTQYLDTDLKQAYTSAGIVHLLAVSGMHVGIIYLALSFVLSFLNTKRYGRALKGGIIILCLWIYASIAGFSPSVVRAALMLSFLVAGQILGRQRNTYNFIAASAFVLCVYNPYCIFDVGFQLSYGAVLGIVYFQPKLYGLLYIRSKLLDGLWKVTCLTLAAQLAVTPIVLYYFHQFPVYFLPANLALVAFTTVIIYLAVLLIALQWIPFVAEGLGWLLAKGLMLLNKSVLWIEALPCSLIDGVYINIAQCIILMLIIVLMAYHWLYRSTQVLVGILLLCIAVAGIRIYHSIEINNQQTFTVYNVQNSTFISFVDGCKGYCLRDSAHITDYFDYSTKNNLVEQGFDSARDLTSVTTCDSLPFSYHSYLTFGGQTIVVLANQPYFIGYSEEKFRLNYALVSSQTKVKPLQALVCIAPDTIIIDSSTPVYKARQWLQAAKEKGIACHWVKEQGAFVHKK